MFKLVFLSYLWFRYSSTSLKSSMVDGSILGETLHAPAHAHTPNFIVITNNYRIPQRHWLKNCSQCTYTISLKHLHPHKHIPQNLVTHPDQQRPHPLLSVTPQRTATCTQTNAHLHTTPTRKLSPHKYRAKTTANTPLYVLDTASSARRKATTLGQANNNRARSPSPVGKQLVVKQQNFVSKAPTTNEIA